MQATRIYGITIRHIINIRRNLDRITDTFYWPAIDIFVWGLTGSYFAIHSGDDHLIFAFLTAMIFWTMLWRVQYEVSVTLLDDMWARNLINLFVSPLTFGEWILSFLIVATIKAIISFFFASLLALMLYNLHVFSYSWYLLPFALILWMSGLSMGFFITGIILRFGAKVQSLGWTLGAVIMPFSAIYYPLKQLPLWAQYIARLLPPSYVFENMRELIYKNSITLEQMLIGLVLAFIYLILSLYWLKRSFQKLLERGMVTLH